MQCGRDWVLSRKCTFTFARYKTIEIDEAPTVVCSYRSYPCNRTCIYAGKR